MRTSARAARIEPFYVMEVAKAASRLAAEVAQSARPMIFLNIGEPDFTAPPLVQEAAARAEKGGEDADQAAGPEKAGGPGQRSRLAVLARQLARPKHPPSRPADEGGEERRDQPARQGAYHLRPCHRADDDPGGERLDDVPAHAAASARKAVIRLPPDLPMVGEDVAAT